MLDKCPVSGWPEVAQIIQEDLGQPPEALFRDFSHTPIASASLAQVSDTVWCMVWFWLLTFMV
jgi:aarF domain-containing kinase